jgi:hypothetical protein
MGDPIARKRLKKKMLDRWENEGGSIAADTTTADAGRPVTDKDKGRKIPSRSDNSTAAAPATKKRQSTRKRP